MTSNDNQEKIKKVLDKVNDLIDIKMDHMFVGGDLVASADLLKDIKKLVKENYDAPKKDIKGYVISLKIDKKGKIPLSITCMQITITPKLFIKSTDEDGFQTFTYSSTELIKYGFKITQLKKIMKAIKNNEVSYRKTSVPISDVLK
jgi:ribosomal protein S10